ncbi:hypothetical protein [Lunatimonas salinarum]|uniref:hypothetical protein n=1 Tax=Lunatimonas salinarum TaxID=1774590 RepID=UPI001AE0D635|nr:hypothetical protein [Lunatimonas salinarum]
MKNYLKASKWLRWVAAGAFGVMLVLNIMISLEFEKDKTLPSLTLIELGNRAYAQGENGSGGNCMPKPIDVSCTAGGPGASQCLLDVEVLGVSRKLQVTCVTEGGCYACCWNNFPGPNYGANCFKD